MPLYLPSFDEIMAVAETRGEDSDAPHLWRGLVGAWPLQEPGGVTAFDVSGYGRHGTLTAMEADDRIITTFGRGTKHDAAGEVVDCGYSSRWNFGTGPFTLIAYGKTSATGNANLMRFDNGSNGLWLLRVDSTGKMQGIIANSARTTSSVTTTAAWHDGAWHSFALVRGYGLISIYVDGKLACTPASDDARDIVANAGARLGIGGYWATDKWTAETWLGQITLPAVYSRATTPAEIQQLYADPWAMYRLRAKVFPAAAAEEPSGFKPYWARPSYQIIGGGIA